MLRVLEIGLMAAVCVAVLAFGGTVPSLFAITQVIILGLGVLFLLSGQFSHFASIRFPVLVPLLLVALVLLQVCPLPVSLAPLLGRAADTLPRQAYFTLSMATYQTVSHLLMLVTYLTAFYLSLVVCRDRNAKKRLILALVSLGLFEALYGMIQYLTGWQQIFAYAKKYYLQDATGTYINRNHFAGLLEMILPFTLCLALRSTEFLSKGASSEARAFRKIVSKTEFSSLVFWLFLATLLLGALVFSRSRMGIISATVSLMVMLALARSPSFRTRIKFAVGISFFLGVLALIVWIGTNPVVNRFETLGHEYGLSGQNRVSIWRDTLGLIRRHPLFGTGLGSFPVVYPSVQTAFLNLFVNHAHCDYLEIASDLGLPGAFLLFGSIVGVLVKTVRKFWEGEGRFDRVVSLGCIGSISAVLIHSLADFNLYIPANALVFTMVLAIAWSTVDSKTAGSLPRSSAF